MWNKNNPYADSDPSGYCIEDACVGEVADGVGLAEGAAIGAEALGDAALAASIRGGISASRRATAMAMQRAGGWLEGRFPGLATGRQRIADNLNHALKQIGESEDVTYQHLSGQIKDYIAYAQQTDIHLLCGFARELNRANRFKKH